MLVRQGTHRNDLIDLQLACALAAVAGALNAAAFYAVGFFSANMTGNVSSISDHLATWQLLPVLFYCGLVIAFMSGATVSTLLINAGHRRDFKGVFAAVVLVEAAGIALLGCTLSWLKLPWRTELVVVGLAFLMGLQNAVVTQISDARVRTTHVSGMVTDIGIEAGLLLDSLIRRGTPGDNDDVNKRLRLHLHSLLAFLAGGVVGVMVYRWVGAGLFWIAGAVLAIIAIVGLVRAGHISDGASASSHLHNDI